MDRHTILIADDDIAMVTALRTRLMATGFDVVTCNDAYQALEFARKSLPDVMLLDINMPAGSGLSVRERLSNIPELAKTPVIYITGDGRAELRQKARDLGAYAVVVKPFVFESLLATIHAAIAREEVEEPAEPTEYIID